MYGLLCSLLPITGVLAVVIFMCSFYSIHHNLYGVQTNWGASTTGEPVEPIKVAVVTVIFSSLLDLKSVVDVV
ncbi:uncharacterized protein EDB93DRAFT_1250772 [Suillus bovinus]|uniref:uncharacterized protein n=1 Tax=Suillus bovinus TaxID=48563 RepID=UPI001B87AB1D|nr:uncharacterized protein EDB93DRAFT_1250772 [Suillus bovinus]KAG2146492.1 hypothetical protein EDB93DRAFT_1250772 [Suillus bovinus]